jgi:hypothetical protein
VRSEPPIQRFLSEVTATAGPFELLGLDPSSSGESEVRRALAGRLARIALHPQGRSAEADEVRLALHVAAAQVLDPRVREELVHDARFARSVEAPTPASAWNDAARFAIASAGGWNARARGRLAALAHAHQVPARELVRAAVLAPSRERAGERPSFDGEAETAGRSAGVAGISSLRRWGALAMLLVMALATADLARRIVVLASGSRATPVPRAPVAPSASAASASKPVSPPLIIRESTRGGPGREHLPALPREASVAESAGKSEVAVEPPPLAEPVRQWAEAARAILDDTSHGDPLARAVSLARVSASAGFLWKGDLESASRWRLAAGEATPTRPGTPTLEAYEDPAKLTAAGTEGDGALALELMGLRRQPAQGVEGFRHRRFSHTRLGPVDCDAVAEAALFGSPQELRLVGRKIVGDQSENPAMIHALLEALPRASRQTPLSTLIAEVTERSLPHVDDPSWATRARAALLERLMDLLSSRVKAGTDGLAGLLARGYRASAGDSSVAPDDVSAAPSVPSARPGIRAMEAVAEALTAEGDSRDATAAAEALWEFWRREAEPLRYVRAFTERVDAVVRLRGVRRSLARGPVQRFLAEQASIAELMGAVVARERLSEAERVAAILARAGERRKTARDVFEQIGCTEEAIVELWLVRFGSAGDEGGGS